MTTSGDFTVMEKPLPNISLVSRRTRHGGLARGKPHPGAFRVKVPDPLGVPDHWVSLWAIHIDSINALIALVHAEGTCILSHCANGFSHIEIDETDTE